MSKKYCAYCGKVLDKVQREHVFPKCLYPPSKAKSKSQRLTVPACDCCNNSWADAEAQFRNVLVMSGENPNPARLELFSGPTLRGLKKIDGKKRIRDLLALMQPVDTESGQRYKIYPAEDDRVLRVVRKIIRGLCYHHKLLPFVSEKRVWADVLRQEVPYYFVSKMNYHHREKDIVEYRYAVIDIEYLHSIWLFKFFQHLRFIGGVSTSEDGFPESSGLTPMRPPLSRENSSPSSRRGGRL